MPPSEEREGPREFLRLIFVRAVEAAETDDEVLALCRAYNRMKRQVAA